MTPPDKSDDLQQQQRQQPQQEKQERQEREEQQDMIQAQEDAAEEREQAGGYQ